MLGALALLGWPARHSLSPVMQNAALRSLGLPYEYHAVEVPPERLATVLVDLRREGFAGGNVTLPHKEAVLALCDEIDERARRVGAVNTLVHRDGRLWGSNTDVVGLDASLAEAGVRIARAKVVVLGAGGAARAVVLAAAEQRASVVVVARNPARGAALGVETVAWEPESLADALAGARLLVNASVAGMDGQPPPCEVPIERLPADAVVFDLVYRPRETPLLSQARSVGLRTIDGLRLLVHQGAASFLAWTGRAAPLAVMEEALARARDP